MNNLCNNLVSEFPSNGGWTKLYIENNTSTKAYNSLYKSVAATVRWLPTTVGHRLGFVVQFYEADYIWTNLPL